MSIYQDDFKIGQVGKLLGISTRTIRYYEEIGLMGNNRYVSGSARFYSEKDVVRLRFILKLKNLGISLKKMREIAINFELNNQATDKILPQLIDILDSHLIGIDVKIDNLVALRNEITDYRKRIVDLLQQVDEELFQVVND